MRRLAVLTPVPALLLAGGFALKSIEWTEPASAPVRVALLQGNVPQQLKWLEEVRTKTLLDYRRMIFEANAKVVVLPETSLPAFLDQLPPDYVESIRAHTAATGKIVLMGTVEREPHDRYYNSLVRFASGAFETYRKRHLVPFGEYIPPGFQWVLAVLHIPLSDFEKGPRVQPPIEAAGIRFGVAICYEDVFGSEVIDALPEAQALLNVSNDAWFGESFAADQHLQASQMRALETGRWMVRATNTGATAAIDPHGRVASRLQPFVHATLIADVVPMQGMTPYARMGDWGALALVAIGALAGARRARKRR
jgi:apolipoprotein N-acyltransferase